MMLRQLRHTCITICGLVALATPLALWLAWSKAMFYLVLVFGCSAVLIIYLLFEYYPDDDF